MWTLIIITIAFSGALSGATSSTTYLDFPDRPRCEAAATAISAPDWVSITSGSPATCWRLPHHHQMRAALKDRQPR